MKSGSSSTLCAITRPPKSAKGAPIRLLEVRCLLWASVYNSSTVGPAAKALGSQDWEGMMTTTDVQQDRSARVATYFAFVFLVGAIIETLIAYFGR